LTVSLRANRLATFALLGVTASWGIAFVWMKDAINQQPFFDFLAIRFTIAALVMVAVRPKTLLMMNRGLLWRGGLLGLILGVAYVAQTIGLEQSTAAITGFFTGLYVVLTPLLAYLLLKQKLSIKVLLGVLLATAGLALISFDGLTWANGIVPLLVCALLYALHIVGLGAWSKGLDAYALTVVQLVGVAVVCWIGALPDGFTPPPNLNVWGAVAFTALFATAAAFFIQTWAQSIMDASRVAILLTSEVVFAAGFAYAIGQEPVRALTVVGGLVMVGAMLVVEWPSKKTKPGLVQLGTDPMTH
jgi:drug/metabolite transporter (DMT)-like permease